MDKKNKMNSIIERWKADVESYRNGALVEICVPQCETCINYIEGNALYCKYYDKERKPKYVLFPEKECYVYESNQPIDIQIADDRENKVYGGLFGFCIGDILGVPVEFSTRQERKEDPIKEMRAYGTYHQPFGTWSDDTSLTICLIDAINNGYSIKKVAENFVKFYQGESFTPYGTVFDIGNSTRDAIIKIISGKSPTDCGGKLETDNGNGSLMRVLPIAFYGQNLKEYELINMVEKVSSLTHNHNRSKLACIFYVEFTIQIILGYKKEEALERTIKFIYNNCQEKYLNEFRYFERILNKTIINAAENEINSTGYVVDTLEAVIWTFFSTDEYQKAILKAINLGGDTDTIAAIVGGIAGIYYGFNAIPNRWIQNIARKEELYDMFKKFCICSLSSLKKSNKDFYS